jgi:hypothetical protein
LEKPAAGLPSSRACREVDQHSTGDEHDDQQGVVEHLDALPGKGQRANDERVADGPTTRKPTGATWLPSWS